MFRFVDGEDLNKPITNACQVSGVVPGKVLLNLGRLIQLDKMVVRRSLTKLNLCMNSTTQLIGSHEHFSDRLWKGGCHKLLRTFAFVLTENKITLKLSRL